MKDEKEILSLDSISFIFRRPWLVVIPFVVITSVTFAVLSHTTFDYRVSAVISFGVEGSSVLDDRMLERSGGLLESLFVGENVRALVKDIWPDLDEDADPTVFQNRVNMLRGRNGVKISQRGRGSRLFNVSFTSPYPETGYKVVRATIDSIKRVNRQANRSELESGLAILKGQYEFYRNRIKELDLAIIAIQDEIQEKASGMGPQERRLLSRITGEKQVQGEIDLAMQKGMQYESILSELNLNLIAAQRRKTQLERRLESGDLRPVIEDPLEKLIKEDSTIRQANSAIAKKKLDLSAMLAQGYMPAHPSAVKIQNEIDRLEVFKQARIEQLSTAAATPEELSQAARERAEKDLLAEIEELEFQVDVLEEKIRAMEIQQQSLEEQITPEGKTPEDIADLPLRLSELRQERAISIGYHTDIKKRIEEAQIRSRLQLSEDHLNIRVIEEPKMPLKPIPFQKIPKLLMGLMLAIGTGGALAYVVDMLDNPVRSASELRQTLGIPVVASIDRIFSRQEIRARNARYLGMAVALVMFTLSSGVIVGTVKNILNLSW
jgi:uncharacterized protein involved in exopolysaccharide biosynthesis